MLKAARAPCGGIVFDGEQVFRAPGNAVQRPAIEAVGKLLIGGLGLRQRAIFSERDDESAASGRSA